MLEIYKKCVEIDRNFAEQKFRFTSVFRSETFTEKYASDVELVARNSAYCLYFLALAFHNFHTGLYFCSSSFRLPLSVG